MATPYPPIASGASLDAPPEQPPSLATLPPSPVNPMGPGAAGPPGGARGSILPQLQFQIEQALDLLARAVPDRADDLDSIKTQLRDIVAQSLSGSPGQGGPSSPMTGGAPV